MSLPYKEQWPFPNAVARFCGAVPLPYKEQWPFPNAVARFCGAVPLPYKEQWPFSNAVAGFVGPCHSLTKSSGHSLMLLQGLWGRATPLQRAVLLRGCAIPYGCCRVCGAVSLANKEQCYCGAVPFPNAVAGFVGLCHSLTKSSAVAGIVGLCHP